MPFGGALYTGCGYHPFLLSWEVRSALGWRSCPGCQPHSRWCLSPWSWGPLMTQFSQSKHFPHQWLNRSIKGNLPSIIRQNQLCAPWAFYFSCPIPSLPFPWSTVLWTQKVSVLCFYKALAEKGGKKQTGSGKGWTWAVVGDPGCLASPLSLQLLGLEEWNWGRLFWGRHMLWGRKSMGRGPWPPEQWSFQPEAVCVRR